MIFKKVMGLATLFALVACGGGKADKGQEKQKAEFEQIAAERTNVEATGYKTAKVTLKHWQKVEGQSQSAELHANYSLNGQTWVLGENDFPASMGTYSNMINFNMILAQQFVTLLQGKLEQGSTVKYYVATESATLDIDGEINATDMVGHLTAEINWDKNGLLTKFYEKDNFSSYRGYSNVQIEETLTVAYAK